jgi:hypothetical protein
MSSQWPPAHPSYPDPNRPVMPVQASPLPKPKRMHSTAKLIGFSVGFLLLGTGIGSAMNGPKASTVNVAAPTVTATVMRTIKVSAATAPAKTPQAPAKAPEKPVGDGVWLVGTDIPPGTYRIAQTLPSGSTCYWSVGAPGAQLPDKNDIVTGGRATVTLVKGKEFKSQDCGDWLKVS